MSDLIASHVHQNNKYNLQNQHDRQENAKLQ